MRDPEHYQYEPDLRNIAEVWRRGSVIASWLLDLTDEAVPTPVLTTSLYERFSSRGEADFANKLLSAVRYGFGGHLEKPAGKSEAGLRKAFL